MFFLGLGVGLRIGPFWGTALGGVAVALGWSVTIPPHIVSRSAIFGTQAMPRR